MRFRIPTKNDTCLTRPMWTTAIWTAVFLCLAVGFVPHASGQIDPATRPSTQELLPETTVAFVQIDDFRDLMGKMSESSMGKLIKDEAVAPLLDGLWDEAKTAYNDVKDQVGVSLEDIQALPSGEITFAVIFPRRAKEPEYMLIVELDNESGAVDRVLDRGRQLITEEAGEEITNEESEDGIEYESFMVDGQKIKFFRKDGLMVGSSSEDELTAFVDRWMGREVEGVRPLSQNRKFVTIMNRCAGTKDLRPEARFFVDPMSIVKIANQGVLSPVVNFTLDAIGLNGLLGVGGAMILTEDEFESVVHGHVLLANPRKGIFEMIAFKPTDYQPESWLPADTATYMTTSWDIDQMLAELGKMIDMVQSEEGVVDTWLEDNLNKEIGLNVKEDILAHVSGRVTYAEWISEPIRINSQVQLFCLELKNPEAFAESFDKIIERINREEEAMLEGEYKGFKTWSLSTVRLEEQMERRRQRRAERGQDIDGLELEADVLPKPALAIVGNYFLMSFSSRSMEFIEHAIDTQEGDSEPLANDELFQSVSRKMTRLLKTDMPCGMTYQNPEHAFRFLFELTKSEQAKGLMSRGSENNPYVAGIQRQFEEHPLPDFDDVKKYFRPSGGFAVADDTGYHFLAFNMRGEEEDQSSGDNN